MHIVVLVLALAAYAYALVASPAFRRWGLAGGAVAAAGLAVYFWQTSPETAEAHQRIAPGELTLDRIEVTPSLRGATMTGRVLNGSDRWRLRDMTIAVRLRDCPEAGAAPADCPVIGEASAIARPDVPPGQIRGFTAQFLFANLPEPEGDLEWDWTITATRATE